jgi:3-hydroxybenzoate 6-monooxygenase
VVLDALGVGATVKRQALLIERIVILPRWADESEADLAAAFQRYQALRILRSGRVQISSMMMDTLMHPAGIRRAIRNALFAGRS